jgi:hypothetical protein
MLGLFGDFIGQLIDLVLTIWSVDSQIRDSSAMTAGSEFDRQSRGFVARLCGGIILLLLLAALLCWWFTKSA